MPELDPSAVPCKTANSGVSQSIYPTAASSTAKLPSVVLSGRADPGFLPQARGTGSSAQPSAGMVEPQAPATSSVVAGSSGLKAPRSLLKLQPYDGSSRVETFLAKFHRMASYIG